MHRKNIGVSFAQWMKKNNLPNVPGAEQILLGQELTPEEALRVRRMLMRAYLDAEGMEVFAETAEFKYPSNVFFLGLFLKLVVDGAVDYRGNPWREQLCDTLTSDDRYAMQIMLDKNYGHSCRRKHH